LQQRGIRTVMLATGIAWFVAATAVVGDWL
jgi:hypothetical protein